MGYTEHSKTLDTYKKMSVGERKRFIAFVTSHMFCVDEMGYDGIRFANGYECPPCGAKRKAIFRFGGTKGGKHRYKCKRCGKTFTAATDTVIYNSELKLSVWREHFSCFMNGQTIRDCAGNCGVFAPTVWRMRHRVCDGPRDIMNSVEMSDIVEADETFFRVSCKGNHKM